MKGCHPDDLDVYCLGFIRMPRRREHIIANAGFIIS